MGVFSITIRSKDKNVMNYFIFFFFKFVSYNLSGVQRCFKNKININKFSVLKSPHVNKKSQERFKIVLFKQEFKLIIYKIFKSFIFLKKLFIDMFSKIDIQIDLVLLIQKILSLKILDTLNFNLKLLNSDKKIFKNYKLTKKFNLLNNNSINKIILIKISSQLFNILDLNGENFFK